MDDDDFDRILHDALLPIIAAHRPQAIVLQCGADAVAEDPLSRLSLSNTCHWRAVRALRDLCPHLLVLGGAALVVFVAVLGVALPIYLSFIDAAMPWVYTLLFESSLMRLTIGGLIAVSVVLACHHWLPGRIGGEARIWPGVLVTVVAWALVARGFSYYVANFASYSATYAGLAGAMVALIFLYLMAAILIYGASFNNALAEVEHPHQD